MAYSPGKPPAVSDADAQALAAYLTDELQVLASALRSVDSTVYSVSNAAPVRPRVGTVVYADGTNWNPGSGEGLYVYSAAGSWIWLEGTAPSLPLSIANGGTGDTGSVWTSYSVTVTTGSGTATATGFWKSIGKTIFITVTITFTSAVTGVVSFNLPVASKRATVFYGEENNVSSHIVVARLTASSTSAVLVDVTSFASPTANTSIFEMNGTYESV